MWIVVFEGIERRRTEAPDKEEGGKATLMKNGADHGGYVANFRNPASPKFRRA
jgi:hypothetical protein